MHRLFQSLRSLLCDELTPSLCGISVGRWRKLLIANRFRIHPGYVPRALFLSGLAVGNSLLNRVDDFRFASRTRRVETPPLLFVLGHWRSGTTLLHNLLSLDPHFAAPTFVQTLFPNSFLTTERWFTPLMKMLLPPTRAVDGVSWGPDEPAEDDLALAASGCSPYLAWSFSETGRRYERYLTLHALSPAEIQAWKETMLRYVQRLAFKYQRPLLLKSPPHTARIRTLRELFPNARFVHLRREPLHVFASTKRLLETGTKSLRLQKLDVADLEPGILRRYKAMYDAFFSDWAELPGERKHELSYEELTVDPRGELRRLYESLALPPFDRIESLVRDYIDSTPVRPSSRPVDLPASTCDLIETSWERNFEEWGYPRQHSMKGSVVPV